MSPSTLWDVAARTHVGRVRTQNEDSFVLDVAHGRFAVIDGMGGSVAGAIAAEHTRIALLDHLDLFEALLVANRTILSEAARHPTHLGMGCVATAAAIHGSTLEVAHVGDTRAYLASNAGAEQLTRDHTVTAEDQEAYGLSDEQARALPYHHAVTNDIGRRPHRTTEWIESHEVPFRRGDVLMLCSDGLHDGVPQTELFARLATARAERWSAADLADRLLTEALEAGGRDNVTILVVRRRHAADQLITTLSKPFSRSEGG